MAQLIHKPKRIKPSQPSAASKAATKIAKQPRAYPPKTITQTDEYIATFCTLNNLRH